MLEKLGEVLKKTTDKVANAIFLDKNLVDNIIRDLQRALIEADVNILLVKQLSDKIKKIAFDERIKGIEKKEHIIKILHDELLSILGKYKKLELNEKQNRILLLGLYGAGKTTTIAKLGNYYAKRGNKVALVGLDVHRPAAKEQLKQLAEKHKLNVFVDMEENDAIKTWKKFEPKLKGYNLILIDTAGRHNLDKELVKEIKSLGKEIEPTETILVMPADIGQAAKTQAQEFKDALNITGVIITRMDSTAKGGGALTACAETEAGIYFLATGEKVNDIEEFNPESFLSRLLGMGDLSQLIEKIKSITNEDEQEKIQKRLEEGKLSLTDVVEQVKSMNQLGGFDKIKSMIPGMSNAKIPTEALGAQEEKIKKWEHIINSMTQEEKDNPELLKKETSRMTRISKGSGVNNSNIRSLLKQYDMLNEMMKTSQSVDMSKGMNQKQLMKLARKFGGKKMKF
ncbi:MAG TPA: signal recognition particle protein [Nanoarchaeota archaeon]|nr:signal recognition particle protein [Nanoarchaeota archaeon]HIH63178.1 signal recognition particle protein [Nanoarchaeota archaeon]HIJ09205.1 signal recognition particle protein [Nanoarchaeota archaeon]